MNDREHNSMEVNFERNCERTLREPLLTGMEAAMPWAELLLLVEPRYAEVENGGLPVRLAFMLRIYFLQRWFNPSDPCAEETLYTLAFVSWMKRGGPPAA